MRYLFLICGCLLSFFSNGQTVNQSFDQIVIEERFYELNKKWPQILNTENLAITQPGSYEMRRRNGTTGNYLFPDFDKEFGSFELIYTLQFHKNAEKNATSGVLIMADENIGTGILFEISKDRKYRISRTNSQGESTYYSNEENKGWVLDKRNIGKKSTIIKIRTHEKKYDLYFNDNFIYSFTEFEFNSGSIGFYIGPNSHCYIKSLVISTAATKQSDSAQSFANLDQVASLKVQLRMKQTEIDRLKAMQANDQKNIEEIKELNQKNRNLRTIIDEQQKVIDSLTKMNTDLIYFKKAITLSNGDVSIESLYSQLAKLRKDSTLLEQKIKEEKNSKQKIEEQLALSETSYQLLQKKNTEQIRFLIRQIDFLTQKLKSDSMHLIDTILLNGQGMMMHRELIPKYKQTTIKKA